MRHTAEDLLDILKKNPVENARGKGWFVKAVEITPTTDMTHLLIAVTLTDSLTNPKKADTKTPAVVLPNLRSQKELVDRIYRELEDLV